MGRPLADDGARPPVCHVVHLLYQFSAGGLENVVTQLLDGLPHDRFRHTVVAVTSVDPTYARRVQRADIEFVALDKPPGQPFQLYPQVVRLMKRLAPDVLHSCNLAALDFVPAAAWAGVPRRVHAEHGWGADDRGGVKRRNQWLRRVYRPWVQDYVAVSEEIAQYLRQRIGVPAPRVHLIANGVDLSRFRPHPPCEPGPLPAGWPFQRGPHCIVGIVGRLEPVKNHALLLDALALARQQDAATAARLRLVLVGDGPLRADLQAQATRLGLEDVLWWAGVRNDVPALLREFDRFVLCSFAEGTSCALQEALASGVEPIATDVGGNRDLLDGGRIGSLVASGDMQGLARELLRAAQGAPSRAPQIRDHAQRFALQPMLDRYAALFAGLAPAPGRASPH
jgi:sugar transferase (PEP-CTERM/EpsH1 system associated)